VKTGWLATKDNAPMAAALLDTSREIMKRFLSNHLIHFHFHRDDSKYRTMILSDCYARIMHRRVETNNKHDMV
jgi:hypothetical protein